MTADLKTFAAASAAARKAADQLRGKLAELRQEIAARKRTLADTESAALPLEEAMEAAQRWIMSRAAFARADGAVAAFVMPTLELSDFDLLPSPVRPVELTNFLCASNPDGLLRLFEARFAEAIDAAPLVLSAAERDERLQSLREEIFRLEVTEEEIIAAAEAAGFEIARRADADPRAVLAVPDAAAA